MNKEKEWFTFYDIIAISIYLIAIIFLWLSFSFHLFESDSLLKIILWFGLITTSLLHVVYYKRLRITAIWSSWIILTLATIGLFFVLVRNPEFKNKIETQMLWMPFLEIIAFRIFRFFYLKMFHSELIIPITRLGVRGFDPERRVMRRADFLFDILIFSTAVLGSFFIPTLL